MARDSGMDNIDPDTGMPYPTYSAPALSYSPKSQVGFQVTPEQEAAFRAATPSGMMYHGIDSETGLPVYHHDDGGGFLGQLGTALQPIAPLLVAAGFDYLTGGAASGALANIFGGGAAAGEAGTTAAMSGGFGAGTTAADIAASDLAAYPTAGIVGSLPEAAGAANGIAATGAAMAAPEALTPLSQVGAAAPAAAPAAVPATTTPLAAVGAPAAAAPAAATTGLGDLAGAGAAGVAGAGGLTAEQIAGSDLAAYPTAGIVGDVPAAAGAANDIAAAGAGLGAAGAAGTAGTAAAGTGLSSYLKQLTDATGLTGTQLASLLQGGIGAVNASNISGAIGSGVDAQAAANAQSQGVLKDVYNQQLGFQQPYQAAGTGAVNTLAASQPYLTHQFDATDLQKGLAPNYDFMLQQGQMANQRAANVGGGALSGNTLQGLQNYTQNYAGNAYQNAFNNYQSQRNNIYNSLSGIAGMGQTANTGAGTAAQNYGTGTVNLNTGLAGVRAAGMLGQAQAGAQGATGVGNSVLLSTLLNQVNPLNPVKP
jgi:hypothetical protein